MAITPEAFQALQALHDGARYNIMHTIARELIDAGLAHSGFGILEITEAGRIWVRRGVQPVGKSRTYITDDANVSNLGGNVNNPPVSNTQPNEPVPITPPLPLVLPPLLEQKPEPEVMPPAPMTDTSLAWSRDRAIAAAGAASGQTDHWPPPAWIVAFMEAYEGAA
jgi:hypothetical protein